MIKLSAKKSKLFYQYLFSYLSIMLIPLIIICIFVYYNVFNVLKEEVVSNNFNTLERARVTIESQMKRLTSTEQYVYLDSVMGSYLLAEDTMAAISTKQELKRCIQSNPFIYDIVYYQADDEYIMSSKTSSRVEVFFEKIYQYEDWGYHDFLKDLETHESGFFLPASMVTLADGETKSLVTYVLPLKGKSVSRCVLYLIEESFFTDLMVSPENAMGISLIANQDGEIVAKTGDDALLQFAKLPEGRENAGLKVQDQVRIGGDLFLLSAIASNDYGWQYITLFPYNLIQDKVVTIRLLMTVVCLAACGIGMVFVIYWMKSNFSPIESLNSLSKKILVADNDKGNELDNVKNVIEYLNQQNESLTLDARANTVEIKERFLIKLLSGRYHEPEVLLQKAGLSGVSFHKTVYAVAVVAVWDLQSGQEQQLEQIYIENAPRFMEAYACVQTEQKRLLLLMGYDGECRRDAGYYLTNMAAAVKEIMKIRCVAGLGGEVRELIRVPQSFREALKAAEYRIVLGKDVLIPYEKVNEYDKVDIPFSAAELTQAVKNRDMAAAENMLLSIAEEVHANCPTAAQVRRICYDLVCTIGKIIEDLNQENFIEKPIYCHIVDQINYESLDELLEITKIIAEDIIRHLGENKERSAIDEMVGFVRDNCFSCEFSTTAMAEYFDISLPHLSQYFKGQMGVNLLDYVTELRMEKAKALLGSTNMVLADVALAVGYYNVNSFSRRFKQVVGVTPGEYRKGK